MTSTWVKICGTTNLEDAQMAIDAGADALGFIFAKSPRRIEADKAAELTAMLPNSIVKVGVFAQETAEDIFEVIGATEIGHVQLHVGASATTAVSLKKRLPSLKIIFGAAPDDDFVFASHEAKDALDCLIFDSGPGTGRSFDWKRAAERIRWFGQRWPIIIAGGLAPENVGEAIRLFRPWGVDVVTGVEARPGKKDPEKVKAFIRAVREADRAS